MTQVKQNAYDVFDSTSWAEAEADQQSINAGVVPRPPPPELYSLREVAEMFGRSERTIRSVTPDIDLSKLTMAEKDALILSLLPLVGQLEAALARIAELEARWHCWRSRPRRRTTRRCRR